MGSIAHVLEERGWVQGQFRNDQGNVCLFEAMVRAYDSEPMAERNHANEIIAALVRDRGYRTIPEFNDDPHTTYEDVHFVAKLTDVEMDA